MISKLPNDLIIEIINKIKYFKEINKFSLLSRKIRLIIIQYKKIRSINFLDETNYFIYINESKINFPNYVNYVNFDKSNNKDLINLNIFNNVVSLSLDNFSEDLIIENLKISSLRLNNCDNVIYKKNNIKMITIRESKIIKFDFNETINHLFIYDSEIEKVNASLFIENIKHIKNINIYNLIVDFKLFYNFTTQNYLDISHSNLNDASYFKNINNIYLNNTKVVNVDCLSNCNEVFLNNTSVNDVNKLGKVKILSLINTLINDDSIKGLGENEELYLDKNNIKNVKHLKNVKKLYLSNTLIENEDIKELGNIDTLILDETKISNIDCLINVRHLSVAKTNITYIPRCFKKLEYLNINDCNIKESISLKNIKNFYIKNTKFSRYTFLMINNCFIDIK